MDSSSPRYAQPKGATGHSTLGVTAAHAINVCVKTKHSRQNDIVKHALWKGVASPIVRRVTAICITPVCGDTVIPSYDRSPGPRCALSTDATESTMLRVSATCTIIDSEVMAVLSLRPDEEQDENMLTDGEC